MASKPASAKWASERRVIGERRVRGLRGDGGGGGCGGGGLGGGGAGFGCCNAHPMKRAVRQVTRRITWRFLRKRRRPEVLVDRRLVHRFNTGRVFNRIDDEAQAQKPFCAINRRGLGHVMRFV